jgi:hypothetical protein
LSARLKQGRDWLMLMLQERADVAQGGFMPKFENSFEAGWENR